MILASSLHKEDLQCVIIKATFFFFLGKGVGLLLCLYICSAGLSFCYRKKNSAKSHNVYGHSEVIKRPTLSRYNLNSVTQNAQGNTLINLQPSCRCNASPSSPSADGLTGAWGQHAPEVSLYSCGLHILADISTPAMVEGLGGANKGLVAGRIYPCPALL